jgi:hypothetical protein
MTVDLHPFPIEFITDDTLPELIHAIGTEARESRIDFAVERIGVSREGRPMFGMRLGSGPHRVGITAGAHADEPVGPMTALALARWLVETDPGWAMLDAHSFFICPQVNPDGAEANRAWFADPLDLRAYASNVRREPPGDDVEFGYPAPDGAAPDDGAPAPPGEPRPENQAVARFLASAGGPFDFHASLHTMAFAEGAWFLIAREWVERTAPLRERLADAARRFNLPLHDIDRRGEKGFHRIAPGFCTTPTSTAMRAHFIERGEPETAALFRPSSMEFVRSLGGDPLVMVSELPMFLIALEYDRGDPPRDPTAFARLREALPQARAAPAKGDAAPLDRLIREFDIRPLPLRDQVGLQATMVVEALKFLMETSD